ncbi:MAG: hydrogenase small subunit [Thermodesulfovibrionales bacterium]|jgi:hydrogenase small subunit
MKKPVLSKNLETELELKGVSRRDFLKYCAATAAILGLSEFDFTARVAEAMESASKKPAVIWLEGQDCAGCTISFLGISYPPVASVILDKISLRYHETAMAGSGYTAEHVLNETIKEGGYVLIVEGSVPSADKRYCMIGGRPFVETLEEAAKNAGAIIAVGACATYGGIPGATPTKGIGLNKALPGKTVINIPTCPAHPDHMIGTILYFLTTGKVPELDGIGRPKMYFRDTIHDNCRRRAHFDAGRFLSDWNDPKQKDWCMFQKGCKGPITTSDCPVRRWNNGINFCIDCGSPCMGCAEPGFYGEMTPLYTAESETSKKIYAMREAGLFQKKNT